MRRNISILLIASIVSLMLPGIALADPAFRAGPAIDQYIETLPDVGGDKPSNAGGDGSTGETGSSGTGITSGTSSAASTSAPSVPSSELSELRASGTDGGATASAIEATSGGFVATDGSGASAKDLLAPLDSADGDTPLAGVLGVLTGSGPGGMALPAVLITALAGGLVVAARGRGDSGNRD